MLFPTQKGDPELYPHRHGWYFAFFHALNWQVAIGTPTVLFMQQLGADSFQIGLVFAWTFLLTPAQVLATAFLPHLGQSGQSGRASAGKTRRRCAVAVAVKSNRQCE